MPSCLLWVLVLQEMVTFGPQRDFWGKEDSSALVQAVAGFQPADQQALYFAIAFEISHSSRDTLWGTRGELKTSLLLMSSWHFFGLSEVFSMKALLSAFQNSRSFSTFLLKLLKSKQNICSVFSNAGRNLHFSQKAVGGGFCKIKRLPLCPTALGLVWLFLLVPDEWLLLILLSYCLQWLWCACNWGAIIQLWLNYMHCDSRNVQCDLWGLLT